MSTLAYLDACPSCPPGIPDASPAVGPPEQVPGGTVTAHQCGLCGSAWSAFWRDGWVIGRLIAPVSPGFSRGDGEDGRADRRAAA